MSRKQSHHLKQTRLDSLFADLGDDNIAVTPAIPNASIGWTWECDSDCIILSCSSDVEQALGFPSSELIGCKLTKFKLTDQSEQQLDVAFQQKIFPLSIDVTYINSSSEYVPATVHIFSSSQNADSKLIGGWHGFTQILSLAPNTPIDIGSIRTDLSPSHEKISKSSDKLSDPKQPTPAAAIQPSKKIGYQVSHNTPEISTATDFLTDIGKESPEKGTKDIFGGSEKIPALMSVPATIPGWSSLLLEILDEYNGRRWSDEERTVVTQVTDQLAIAFENARLFQQNLTLFNEVDHDRARYSDLYNRAPNCYFSIDPEGLFLEINDTGLSMLGYSHDELVGKFKLTDILSRDSHPIFSDNFQKLRQSGRIENVQIDFIRKDGSTLAGLVDATGLYDEKGIIQNIRVVVRDVTRVRQLEERQRQLVRAIDATADLVLVTERNGTIIFANPALEIITGYSREEVIGSTPRILRSDKQDTGYYSKMWSTILAGQVWRGELINKRKNGTLYHAQLTISPITNEDGQVTQFVAVQRDITAQKRAESERERLLVETEILYRASAELNTAQSYLDILNTLRHYTVAGRKSQSVYLAIFDTPWTEEVVPQWIDFLARWTKGTSVLQDQRFPMRSFTSLLKIMNPETPLAIDDIEIDTRLDSFIKKLFSQNFKAVSSVFVPLIVGNRWIGFINANYPTRMEFLDYEIRRLMGIAGQAAVAFQNLRLLDETRTRNEELATINTIIGTASHSLDLDSMLNEILDRVLSVIKFKAGLVSIPDIKTGKLHLIAQQNLPGSLLSTFTAQGLENTLCDWVYKRGEVLHISNFQDGAPIDVTSLLNSGLSSYLGVPLTSKNKILGTLCIFGDRPYIAQRANIKLMQAIGQQVGVAVENALLFEQTEQALTDTEQLYAANKALNAVQSYSDVLEVVRKYSLLEAPSTLDISMSLFDPTDARGPAGEWLLPIARWEVAVGLQESLPKIPLCDLGTIRDHWSDDNVLIVTDPNQDNRLDQSSRAFFLKNNDAGSLLLAPILIAGDWAGIIHAVFSDKISYSDKDIRKLISLLGQAGVALHNIRLLHETRRKAEQLQTAAKIARDTSTTSALEELLNSAVSLICQGFNYYHASIFLIDEENANAVVMASTGPAGEEMKRRNHSLPVGSKSVIGYVTAQGHPLVLNNVMEESIHRANPLLPNTRAESGIPLKISDRVIGALDVQSTEINAFTVDDVSVLQILADQLAIAVENARSFEITRQAVDEMRKADLLKSQFLANMSHELRTPLNSIIGFSRVILKGIDGPVTELQQQDLTAIYNSGQHLLNLINDILDLSKIEAGKMELSIEDDVSISDIINSVLLTVAGLVKDKPIELKQEIPQDLPHLRADPLKIRQVLINLFSNAAKFTEKGSISIRAQLQVGENGRPEIGVQITDTGPGISPEDQKKLFLPFSQVDSSPTRKTGGSGLGLSICRHLVEMHGGKIGVVSKELQGSTFYFSLPVRGITKSLPDSSVPKEDPDKVILAVDDELQIIQIYERYLKPLGYRIIGITNPSQTLEFAKQIHPVAILLDDLMPELNGWQVFELIKNDPKISDIPVIFCAIRDEREQAERVGAAGYLLKPVLETDLAQVVSRIGIRASQRKILVIESAPDEEKQILSMLEHISTYYVSVARSGRQALTALRVDPPDIILIDLVLPDLDGYALLETLQSDPNLAQIPIILLTRTDADKHQNHDLIHHVLSFIDIESLSTDILKQEIDKALELNGNSG